MNTAVEADRALLRRRAEELPTVGLCAVAATTDELVDPLVLPTQMAVDDDVVEDVPGVLRAVRGPAAAGGRVAGLGAGGDGVRPGRPVAGRRGPDAGRVRPVSYAATFAKLKTQVSSDSAEW